MKLRAVMSWNGEDYVVGCQYTAFHIYFKMACFVSVLIYTRPSSGRGAPIQFRHVVGREILILSGKDGARARKRYLIFAHVCPPVLCESLEAAGFVVGVVGHNLALFSGRLGCFLVLVIISATAAVISLP